MTLNNIEKYSGYMYDILNPKDGMGKIINDFMKDIYLSGTSDYIESTIQDGEEKIVSSEYNGNGKLPSVLTVNENEIQKVIYEDKDMSELKRTKKEEITIVLNDGTEIGVKIPGTNLKAIRGYITRYQKGEYSGRYKGVNKVEYTFKEGYGLRVTFYGGEIYLIPKIYLTSEYYEYQQKRETLLDAYNYTKVSKLTEGEIYYVFDGKRRQRLMIYMGKRYKSSVTNEKRTVVQGYLFCDLVGNETVTVLNNVSMYSTKEYKTLNIYKVNTVGNISEEEQKVKVEGIVKEDKVLKNLSTQLNVLNGISDEELIKGCQEYKRDKKGFYKKIEGKIDESVQGITETIQEYINVIDSSIGNEERLRSFKKLLDEGKIPTIENQVSKFEKLYRWAVEEDEIPYMLNQWTSIGAYSYLNYNKSRKDAKALDDRISKTKDVYTIRGHIYDLVNYDTSGINFMAQDFGVIELGETVTIKKNKSDYNCTKVRLLKF